MKPLFQLTDKICTYNKRRPRTKISLTLPVPGGPASRTALPAIFFVFISSTTTPAAWHKTYFDIRFTTSLDLNIFMVCNLSTIISTCKIKAVQTTWDGKNLHYDGTMTYSYCKGYSWWECCKSIVIFQTCHRFDHYYKIRVPLTPYQCASISLIQESTSLLDNLLENNLLMFPLIAPFLLLDFQSTDTFWYL